MKHLSYLVLAFVLGGCVAPAVAIPLFTTAAVMGAGAAVGAGAINIGYDHIPFINSPTPSPTATPTLVTK